MSASVHGAYVDGYMTWFYKVSHLIMTPYTLRIPHKPSNQDVLEARDDHTYDISSICRCIEDMAVSGIYVGLFEVGSSQLALIECIITEARIALVHADKPTVRHTR